MRVDYNKLSKLPSSKGARKQYRVYLHARSIYFAIGSCLFEVTSFLRLRFLVFLSSTPGHSLCTDPEKNLNNFQRNRQGEISVEQVRRVFDDNLGIIFHISPWKLTLWVLIWGDSNEYPQHVFMKN